MSIESRIEKLEKLLNAPDAEDSKPVILWVTDIEGIERAEKMGKNVLIIGWQENPA